MVQVVCDHRRTTTAIHQMIEAHTVNIFGFEQVKNRIQILHIVTRNREAQPDLLTRRHAVADTAQRELVRPLLATELIVRIFATVQADTHIAHAHRFKLLRHIRRDAGAVRRNRRTDSLARRIVRKFKKIRTQKRFATAEQQHRHIKFRKLVNKLDTLFVRKFVLVLNRL